MPASSSPRPWRRRIRLSVRGLIVLVLVVGAGLGWIVRAARIQREAVAAIEQAGGSVQYDRDLKTGLARSPQGPQWLVDRVGVDYFANVVVVRLPPKRALIWFERGADAELAYVGRLHRLERLWLSDSTVTEAGMAHLAGLTHLESLGLRNTPITDGGMAHLAGLKSLKVLDLAGTEITDAGLAAMGLDQLVGLEDLDLTFTKVSDSGLARVKRLTRLKKLLRLMSAFWWDPVGTEAGPTGKGRDWGQWGGPSCPPPLNLHQLPDMSHYCFRVRRSRTPDWRT